MNIKDPAFKKNDNPVSALQGPAWRSALTGFNPIASHANTILRGGRQLKQMALAVFCEMILTSSYAKFLELN